MKTQIESLKERALAACNGASDVQALQEARVKFLGKKGELTALLRNMGNLPPEERPLVGKVVNEVRDQLEQAWKQKETDLAASKLQAQLEAETLDITLPGRKPRKGTYHPLTLVLNEIKSVFISMGYQVVEYPESKSDYYNFEALNIPKDHPARDMQDTFYLTEHLLLRSQTSPVQIRTMERQQPPVRIIAPERYIVLTQM